MKMIIELTESQRRLFLPRGMAMLLLTMAVILGSSFGERAALTAKAQENTEEISVTGMNQVMTVAADCEARELPDHNAAAVMSFSAGGSVWVVGETQSGWYKVSYQGKQGFIPKESVMELQVEIDGSRVSLSGIGSNEVMTGVPETEENNDISSLAEGNGKGEDSQKEDPSREDSMENGVEEDDRQEGSADKSPDGEDPAKEDPAGEVLAGQAPGGQSEGASSQGGKKTVSLKEAGLDTEMAAMEAENKILVEEVERQRAEKKRSRIWTAVIALLVVAIFAAGIISTVKGNKNGKEETKTGMDSNPKTKRKNEEPEIIDMDSDEDRS